MKLILLILFVGLSFGVNATDYYISAASGNDANSGTSTSSPWKSLNKLNSVTLKPGDNVYFNRGEVFYGGITIRQSGTSGSPIKFGAYGSGEKPIISGLASINSWTNLGGNIWESTDAVSSSARINIVFANGKYVPMGRFPNSGWLTYEKQTVAGAGVTISSSGLGGNWTGAEILIYGNRYSLDRGIVTAQSGQLLSYTKGSEMIYEQKTPKFIIQNDPRTLDSQGEWYFNPITKRLRIYSTSTPANVQVATTDNLVDINGYDYISLDQLSFIGANGSTINLLGSKYITIKNCDIDYSGKTAIEGRRGVAMATGLIIQNCSINHSNKSAIELYKTFDFATINSNTIKNTGWVPSMLETNARGIDAQGNNSVISYNTIDSSAFVGIQYLGDHSVVTNNFITNFDLYLTDGGGIYTWNGWGGTIKSNIKIMNNIIINKKTDHGDVGIYLDDWANNIEVSGNTVVGCGWGLSAGNAFNVKFSNNTAYDNSMAGIFLLRSSTQPVAGKLGMDNIEVTNNVFFVKFPVTDGVGAHTMFIMDASSGSQLPTNSKFDYNYYVSPVFTKGHLYSYFNSKGADRYLSNWQSYSGQDANSKETPKPITDINNLRFEYNATNSSKSINLNAAYIDAKGTRYNGTITLAPFTSAVLILDGPATNQAPVANAGSDQVVTLPTNSVNLAGKGSDADGSIASYTWTKISGPSAGTITNPTSATASVRDMVEGTYLFELKVSDNIGAVGLDTVEVVVKTSGNSVPVANAGSDQSITLPTSSTSLIGNGSVTGGTIASYNWTKVSGPAGGTISSPSAATTNVTGLTQGIYQFQLKVTDNNGTTSTSTVQVIVNAADGLLPAVNPDNVVNGLDYNYYENVSAYSVVPSFFSIKPVKTGTTSNFDISLADRAQVFAFNFTGFVDVPSDGQYTFYTNSDDGSTLYIDNVLVVDNDGLHGARERSGTIGLKAGKHVISVGYIQMGGGSLLNVNYSGPGISKRTIPASSLYRISGSLLPALNPINIVNGLDYNYYENVSSYNKVPTFSSLKPLKTGTSDNFDISLADRAQVFAFNFNGYIDIPSDGQYTFYSNSDDGSKLYIDDVLVVDNDGLHGVMEKSGTIGLKAGKHAISVGYIQMGGGAVLKISYSGAGINKQPIPSIALYKISGNLLPAVNPSNTVNGLNYSYYENVSSSNKVPIFSSIKPVKTGTSSNFDISNADRAQVFAFSFNGYIEVPSDGQYTFYSNSDDGSKLYIDNVLVVDNDGLHGVVEKSGTIGLKAGKHAISVGYLQMGGGAVLNVSYSGSGIAKQRIPTESLYRVLTSGGTRNGVGTLATLQSAADSSMSIRSATEDLSKIGIKAYPNPFADYVIVSISGKAGDYKMILVDAIGRTVWTKIGVKQDGVFEHSINTSSLKRGLYFLKIIQNDTSSSIKLEK